MPYSLDEKLVIAVASSALFDLTDSDAVYRQKGEAAYRDHQRANQQNVLAPGVAYPFIKRLLGLNEGNYQPVEVILLSRNDPDTGMRVQHSIEAHKLPIGRAAFLSGQSPARYIGAFRASLFLSANQADVQEAINMGYPAGRVLETAFCDSADDAELRIAFDFDGVLIDHGPESIYQAGGLEAFNQSERSLATVPHADGPLKSLLEKIARIQQQERAKQQSDPAYAPKVRVAIITARGAPVLERMVTTLRAWGISTDATFLLGGIEKTAVLNEFKPHIFFDDQMVHLDMSSGVVPSVHVPMRTLADPHSRAG